MSLLAVRSCPKFILRRRAVVARQSHKLKVGGSIPPVRNHQIYCLTNIINLKGKNKMPCFDTRDRIKVVYAKGVDPSYRDEAERLSKRCKELTALLCKAGRARYHKTDIPVEVLNWWQEHCKIDAAHGEPW